MSLQAGKFSRSFLFAKLVAFLIPIVPIPIAIGTIGIGTMGTPKNYSQTVVYNFKKPILESIGN